MTTEQFVSTFTTDFHNLQGLTVSERKKSLFHLLNSASILHTNSSLLDAITSQLQPRTHLEKLFYIEFLICFKKYQELVHEFLNGNDIVIKRVGNQRWFFERLLNEYGSEFITCFIPLLSYRLTLKVFKKIASILNETQADEFFEAIFKVYGIQLAVNILSCCSSDKIEGILKNYPVKLSFWQLKSLYCKRPHLIYIYLEEKEKHEGSRDFMNFNPIFEYIARNNVDMYQDLCLKYDFKTKLGKRTTEKFVKAKKQDIVAHPEQYVKNLNPSRLIKLLGSDFNKVYLKLFPKKVEDCPTSEVSRLLKYYPKKEQYNLVVTTFNKIFAKKLDECPHLIDDYILQMISEPEERERLAKIKSRGDEDTYLKYYQPGHCLQIIKERINFARAPFERANFVNTLTESCIVNKDYDALLDVAKFVAERFKNDSADVQQRFLQTLIYHKCDFDMLHQGHWEEINKITASPNLLSYGYDISEIFYRYIEYLIKMKKSINNEIISFFKNKNLVVDQVQLISNGDAQKLFLLKFIELVPQLATTANTIEEFDCKLLSACQKYNLKYPKTPINVYEFPRLLQSFKNTLMQKKEFELTTISSALQLVLCVDYMKESEELRRLFWNNIQFATPFILKWFLKYRPDFIQANFDAFMTFCTKNTALNKDKKMWAYIKCYSHLKMDSRAIHFCISNLTPQNCEILSHLMSKQDFLALVKSNKPKEFGSNETSTDNKQLNIQMALIKCLAKVNSSPESLALITEFCNGNYVSLCLGPLYSAFCNTPKNHLNDFVEKLKNHNESSLKKHSYYILSLIFNKETVLKNLEQCHLDQSAAISFKYFLQNPSLESWNIFLSKLHELDKLDIYTSKLIASEHVPIRYKAQHFENVWTVLHRNHNKHRMILIKNVQTETILELNSDFLSKIINCDLFSGEEINKFISTYIVASQADDKTDIVCGAIANHRKSTQFSMQKFRNFISTLFGVYTEWHTHNEHLVEHLFTRLQKIFSTTEIFKEYIMMSFMKCKNQNLHNLSVSVIQIHNNLLRKYGETVTAIFAEVLKELLPHFCPKVGVYRLCHLLLSSKTSAGDLLLIIKLLPLESEPEDKENHIYYENILSVLQQDATSIQIHLNLFFKYNKMTQNVSYYNKTGSYFINTSSWLSFGARKKIGYYYY